MLDQIKSQPCKTTIGILFAAKSKIIKHWKTLDARITDAANEAKDNVKYLYTLMKFCKPLKRCSPVEMLDCIPGLIIAIRMINSISRYYNTSERMTSPFVKVTNQVGLYYFVFAIHYELSNRLLHLSYEVLSLLTWIA